MMPAKPLRGSLVGALLAAVILFACATAGRAEEGKTAPAEPEFVIPPAAQIASLVADLSSESFKVRNRATVQLRKIAEELRKKGKGFPQAEALRNSKDPELLFRAEAILKAREEDALQQPEPKARITARAREAGLPEAEIKRVMGMKDPAFAVEIEILLMTERRVARAPWDGKECDKASEALRGVIEKCGRKAADVASSPEFAELRKNPPVLRECLARMIQDNIDVAETAKLCADLLAAIDARSLLKKVIAAKVESFVQGREDGLYSRRRTAQSVPGNWLKYLDLLQPEDATSLLRDSIMPKAWNYANPYALGPLSAVDGILDALEASPRKEQYTSVIGSVVTGEFHPMAKNQFFMMLLNADKPAAPGLLKWFLIDKPSAGNYVNHMQQPGGNRGSVRRMAVELLSADDTPRQIVKNALSMLAGNTYYYYGPRNIRKPAGNEPSYIPVALPCLYAPDIAVNTFAINYLRQQEYEPLLDHIELLCDGENRPLRQAAYNVLLSYNTGRARSIFYKRLEKEQWETALNYLQQYQHNDKGCVKPLRSVYGRLDNVHSKYQAIMLLGRFGGDEEFPLFEEFLGELKKGGNMTKWMYPQACIALLGLNADKKKVLGLFEKHYDREAWDILQQPYLIQQAIPKLEKLGWDKIQPLYFDLVEGAAKQAPNNAFNPFNRQEVGDPRRLFGVSEAVKLGKAGKAKLGGLYEKMLALDVDYLAIFFIEALPDKLDAKAAARLVAVMETGKNSEGRKAAFDLLKKKAPDKKLDFNPDAADEARAAQCKAVRELFKEE